MTSFWPLKAKIYEDERYTENTSPAITNRKNLIKKNNFNPELLRNNSFDSIIKIQNFLHLPPFFQQPQNHLKKQENWYITRGKSALGLLSELCFLSWKRGNLLIERDGKGIFFLFSLCWRRENRMMFFSSVWR